MRGQGGLLKKPAWFKRSLPWVTLNTGQSPTTASWGSPRRSRGAFLVLTLFTRLLPTSEPRQKTLTEDCYRILGPRTCQPAGRLHELHSAGCARNPLWIADFGLRIPRIVACCKEIYGYCYEQELIVVFFSSCDSRAQDIEAISDAARGNKHPPTPKTALSVRVRGVSYGMADVFLENVQADKITTTSYETTSSPLTPPRKRGQRAT